MGSEIGATRVPKRGGRQVRKWVGCAKWGRRLWVWERVSEGFLHLSTKKRVRGVSLQYLRGFFTRRSVTRRDGCKTEAELAVGARRETLEEIPGITWSDVKARRFKAVRIDGLPNRVAGLAMTRRLGHGSEI